MLSDETLKFTEYEATHEGMIKSWAERFPKEEFAKLDQIIMDLHEKDSAFFGK